MDLLEALAAIPKLIEDYRAISEKLAETQRELESLKSDRYVPLEWVADHWSVTTETAREMLKVLAKGNGRPDARIGRKQPDIKVLSYGQRIVRYRRSDIERITESSLVNLRDMLAIKRANKSLRNQ